MSVLPIVSPANNAEGVALMPTISALYPFSLEQGSIDAVNCFLVKKVSTLGSNTTTLIPVKIQLKRINLNDNSDYLGFDYGDQNAGNNYRSLIEIAPAENLNSHTEYSVILSKEISKTSIFDIKSSLQNSGTHTPSVKGPYSGVIATTYKIDIVIGGTESLATYKVTRLSDGHTVNNLVAKKRFIEIQDGLFVKFNLGTYVAGDSFTVACIPSVKTNEIYSWDFKTGDSLHITPADQNSNVSIGLPVDAPASPVDPFRLVSVTPSLNSVMNNPGAYSEVSIQGIKIRSKKRKSEINNKIFKIIINEVTTPSLIADENSFTLNANSNTSKNEICNAINSSSMELVASTDVATEIIQEDAVGLAFKNGVNGTKVAFLFNKPVDPSSVTLENFKIKIESTINNLFDFADFEYNVIDNKIIIEFL